MRLKMMLAEAVRSIGANISTTVAATMTVLIGMFLLGLFIALGTYVLSWSDHVKSELVVKVFFDRDVKPAQVEAVRVQLDSNNQVRKFELVTAEQGLEKIKKQRPELFGSDGLPFNPLGPAYTITPIKAEYTETIANSLRPLPTGVHRVTYGKKTAEKILSVAKVIESIFLIAVIVLLSASTILIANTIRLSIFARRREIEVMKLVGATNWFVRGPFMLEGLICGLGGSLLAVILLFVGKEAALPSILPRLDSGPDVNAMGFWAIALILLAFGLLLGAAGSGLTLRRFLRV
ncbi:MAG TPA: permease-like cell division protein FtsX [Gaiellaceae bacterium]|nr:permease-like cell division protein FtsX [Gaiellaceae bacterium]